MKKFFKKLILFAYVDALDYTKLQSLTRDGFFFKDVVYTKTIKNIPGYSFGIQSTLLAGKPPQEHYHWMPYIYLEEKKTIDERIKKSLLPLKYLFPLKSRYKNTMSEFTYRVFNNMFHVFANGRKALLPSMPIEWYEKIYLYPYYYMNESSFYSKFAQEVRQLGYEVRYVGHSLKRCASDLPHVIRDLGKDGYEYILLLLYVDDLDMIGHRYGVSTEVYSQSLTSVDLFLSEVSKICDNLSNEFILIVFSDHGLCDTITTVNLINALKMYEKVIELIIIDATLAFIWVKEDSGIDELVQYLKRRLGNIANIFTLRDDRKELEKMGVYFRNRQYGDVIIQLKPCLTFLPNFYSSIKPLRALHGFWPDEPVQNSLIIFKDFCSDIHDIDKLNTITDIHNLLIKLIKRSQ